MPAKKTSMLETTKKDKEREEERGRRREEERGSQVTDGGGSMATKGREWKVAYQNVGRGIETTNILLDRGRQENWDLVFVAEAWEGKKGERTIQQGYRMFGQEGSNITLYIREEVDLHQTGVRIETSQNWIAVREIVTGVYLSPSLNMETLKEALTEIPATDNIIGDFNCTQRYKRRALLEKITAKNLREVPINSNTWRRWHRPQLR